jgi:hypothetical protein
MEREPSGMKECVCRGSRGDAPSGMKESVCRGSSGMKESVCRGSSGMKESVCRGSRGDACMHVDAPTCIASTIDGRELDDAVCSDAVSFMPFC